ncbi:MAG: phosphate acyltransferase PlsX [Bacteroidales bacterium]|jgi:glycerol-3-phosphate acyltransferase PlsX|nr:phosphate acyltransferase PlsX [Bacteroidales bacterium]MDD3700893.1 phosphate acyltransferase PlsX [Bacteroidales bacterium]
MRLGLDVFGGDFAPQATLDSLKLLIPELTADTTIVLYGDEQHITNYLKNQFANQNGIEIVHAPDTIGMGDKSTKTFHTKPQSSIVKGFEDLTNDAIDVFASAGNSGAMMVGAVNAVNTIPGIIRPASCVPIPKISGGYNIILDAGTNPDTKAEVLYQYGLLGKLYAKHVLAIPNPRIGLLNIGEEEKKGNLLVQTAFQMMKDCPYFNFIGNIESRDLFRDKADVIVCDGFIGNIVIKQIEAMYRIMEKRNLLDDYFVRFNYELHGGSPIIGINKNLILGHGISNALAIKNMMLTARDIAFSGLNQKIKEAFKEIEKEK